MAGARGCNFTTGELVTERYTQPLPFIGLYIAVASIACSLLLTIDIYGGFTRRSRPFPFKQWFTCRWFDLNAFTMTLLSVATKLPVDLNTSMPRPHHQLTKMSGTVMLSLSMAFFLPSFGEMETENVLANVAALVVLVVTVAVNICIQMGTGVVYAFWFEHLVVVCLMLFMLIVSFNTAICNKAFKDQVKETRDLIFKRFDDRYTALIEKLPTFVQDVEDIVTLCKESLPKRVFIGYSEQSVDVNHAIIRSRNSRTIGLLSFFVVLVFIESEIRALALSRFVTGKRRMEARVSINYFCQGNSDYKWSVWLVLISQNLFIFLAFVALSFRWYHAVWGLRKPTNCDLSLRKEASKFLSAYETLSRIQMDPLYNTIRSLLGQIGTAFLYVQAFTSLICGVASQVSSAPVYLFHWWKDHQQHQREKEAEVSLVETGDDVYKLSDNYMASVEAILNKKEDDFVYHRRLLRRQLRAVRNDMDRLTSRVKTMMPNDPKATLENLFFVSGYHNTAASLLLDKKNHLWETVVWSLDNNDQTGCCLQLSALAFVIRHLFLDGQRGQLEKFVRAFHVLRPLLSHIDRYGFDQSRESTWKEADWLLNEALREHLPDLQNEIPPLAGQQNPPPDYKTYSSAVAFYCQHFVACEYLSRYEGEVKFMPSSSMEQTMEEASRIVAGTIGKIWPTIKKSLPPLVPGGKAFHPRITPQEKEPYDLRANTEFFYYLDHLKKPLSPILFEIRQHLLEVDAKLDSLKNEKKTLVDRMDKAHKLHPQRLIVEDLQAYKTRSELFVVVVLYFTHWLTSLSENPTEEEKTAKEHAFHVRPYLKLFRRLVKLERVLAVDLVWEMIETPLSLYQECVGDKSPDIQDIIRDLPNKTLLGMKERDLGTKEELQAVGEVLNDICPRISRIKNLNSSTITQRQLVQLKCDAWLILYNLFSSLARTSNAQAAT